MRQMFSSWLVPLCTMALVSCTYDWSVPKRKDAGTDAKIDTVLVEDSDFDASDQESPGDDGRDASIEEAPDAAPPTDDGAVPSPIVNCNAGTTADEDGICQDIDECTESAHDCDSEPVACVDLAAADGQPFRCQCPAGFKGDGVGDDGCVDVDECATGAAQCEALSPCNNVPGAYKCGDCPVGYSGGAGGVCNDIDECAVDNGGCDALAGCNNTPGAFQCGACPAGYAGDGATGCTPTLTGLTAAGGALTPGFDPNVAQYLLPASLTVQTVTLTPTSPAGTAITVNGAAVASGATWTSSVLNLGDNAVTIVVSQTGRPSRTYSVTARRGYLQAFIKAASAGASQAFGYSVSMADNTLVVGAPSESGPRPGLTEALPESGAAYVFTFGGGGWRQDAYLKASNASAGDRFGTSVSTTQRVQSVPVAGSPLRMIAIGAPGEDSTANLGTAFPLDESRTDSGAVYLFIDNQQTAMLKPWKNVDANDRFGSSVSVYERFIAVGVPGDDSAVSTTRTDLADNNATDSGAAYVFECKQGVCDREPIPLKASNTNAGDAFGSSIAVTGFSTIAANGSTLPERPISVLVGAPGEDSAAVNIGGEPLSNTQTDSGAAYVFAVMDRNATESAYLKAFNTASGDAFGTSVGAFVDQLIVGAPGEDSSATGVGGSQTSNSATNAGAAYTYSYNGSSWTTGSYLKATNTGVGDRFGTAVAISQDRAIVGAPAEASAASGVGGNAEDNSLPGSGAAYTFAWSGSTWTSEAYLKATNSSADDGFGSAVTVDRARNYVVGAPREDSAAQGVSTAAGNDESAANRGASYAFR